jgi:hypothetical protein
MEAGSGKREVGRWKMEDGRWKMEDGRWKRGGERQRAEQDYRIAKWAGCRKEARSNTNRKPQTRMPTQVTPRFSLGRKTWGIRRK